MSDANLAKIATIDEASWSVLPPTPQFTQKRFTKDTLNYAKETVISSELRSDRQVSDIIQVGFSSLGGYDFELSARDFGQLFKCALYCTPQVINLTNVAIVCDQTAGTITAAVGTFTQSLTFARLRMSGLVPAGVSLNENQVVLVVQVATDGSEMLVEGLLDDFTGTANFASTVYRNGIVRNSIAIEKNLAPGSFLLYEGMLVNTMKITLEAKKIMLGTCDFIGKGAKANTTSASTAPYTAPTTNPVLNCSSNVGQVTQKGTPISTALRMIALDLNNNLRPIPSIGQPDLWGVGLGRSELRGTMSLYFVDNSTLNDFLTHTPTSFGAVVRDANGDGISFDVPSLQYSSGKTDVTGINTDVYLEAEYDAFMDPLLGFTYQICTF